MATVTVLGAGMMGSAFCVPLVDAGHQVRLVGTHLDDEIVRSLRQTGAHPKLGLEPPREIAVYRSTELATAMNGVDLIGVGVSSAGVSWAAQALGRRAPRGVPLVMVTKGLALAEGELRILPDVLAEQIANVRGDGVAPCAIAGPCIAGELARRVPTCVVLTGRDPPLIDRVAALLRTPYYSVWPSYDVVGVEVCAALKNAFAMGMAFGAGLHEREGGVAGPVAMHNLEAATFAESVVEMQRVVAALGGDPSSAVWLPGVGDLDVTCSGGRTGRFGRLLGLGLTPAEAVSRMEGATLECLEILSILRAAMPLLEQRGLKASALPLLCHMAEVALDGRPVDVPLGHFFGGSGPTAARPWRRRGPPG